MTVWPLAVTLAARLSVAGAEKLAPLAGAVKATAGSRLVTVTLAAVESSVLPLS